MSFMQKEIHEGDGWIAETDNGSVAIPDWNAPDVDELRKMIGQRVTIGDLYGTLEAVEYIPSAYWGRYSAPGYMDCTSWMYSTVSREELEEDLERMYGDDEGEDADND